MLLHFIELAFLVSFSTTYGYGEFYCGDIGRPRPCERGAITASGEPFDPDLPTAAVFAPTNLRIIPTVVHMRIDDGPCAEILVTDKGNPRFIGKRGFDLTPGALRALGIEPHSKWSGYVQPCQPEGDNNEQTDFNPSTPATNL